MLECGAARLHILLDFFALAQGDMTLADVARYPFASEQPSTVLLALDMPLGPPLSHLQGGLLSGLPHPASLVAI